MILILLNNLLPKMRNKQKEYTKNEKKVGKIQTHDSSVFICQNYFGNERSRNFSMFQSVSKTFTMPAGFTDAVVGCESKGFSNDVKMMKWLSNDSEWL